MSVGGDERRKDILAFLKALTNCLIFSSPKFALSKTFRKKWLE